MRRARLPLAFGCLLLLAGCASAPYRELIALRRQHPALQGGQAAVLPTGKPAVAAVLRRAGDDIVLTVANLGSSTETLAGIRVPADLSGVTLTVEPLWGGGTATRLLPGGNSMTANPALSVPPRTALVFRVVP